MKPFFIYTNNANLYIKNINEKEEKIASNIYIYTVNIDEFDNLEIFCIDKFARIIKISKVKNSFTQKVVGEFPSKVKHIKDLRCNDNKDYFNLVILEQSVFCSKTHNINIKKENIEKLTI